MRQATLSLFLLLVLQLLLPGRLVGSEADAPFGLTWGATAEEIKALGVELKPSEAADFGASFIASKLPRSISGQEGTVLSFGHDNRLWRVAAISVPFANDPYGIAAKERYQELVAVLGEKYGKGHSVEQVAEGYFSEPKHFVYGISQGESQWFTNFENPDLFVQLGLYAPNLSDLRWRLIYENKGLRTAFEQEKKVREKGSL